ncbi:6-phosphofructokinase, partial [Trichostrongylus colubriformis]
MSFRKSIGVITSGSDAQGMNSAIRAVVRCGLRRNCKVFFVYEGFEGLITNRVEEAKWESVSNIINKGGTILGSTRCVAFQNKEERRKAALTLHTHKIYYLVCIGGDGSLTGLNIFRDEWQSFTAELLKAGAINKEQAEKGKQLSVVGIAGTIDNNFIGTDRTIGFDSAMARVIECVDNLTATAMSHHRTFVVEVMSYECGTLALTAAIALEADFVFIPEIPPPDDWPETLCAHLVRKRKAGSPLHLVIVAEGAVDAQGKPIKSEQIKKVLEEKLKYDVRVASLGYLQRGGCPSFLDRLLGCRMGHEAVDAVLKCDPASPKLLCLKGHVIVKLPLSKLIGKTQRVREEKKKGSFNEAIDIRGKNFRQKTDFIQ